MLSYAGIVRCSHLTERVRAKEVLRGLFSGLTSEVGDVMLIVLAERVDVLRFVLNFII